MRVWWLPWRKIRRAVNRQGFQLDLNAWNGVLASWAESGDPNAANRIRLVIEKLQKIIEQQPKLPGSAAAGTTQQHSLHTRRLQYAPELLGTAGYCGGGLIGGTIVSMDGKARKSTAPS
jgi:hypothetical protein